MSDIEFYKFINEFAFESRWEGDELLIWVSAYNVGEFIETLNYDSCDDGGYVVRIQSDCICLDIVDLCEQYNVNPEDILEKVEQN